MANYYLDLLPRHHVHMHSHLQKLCIYVIPLLAKIKELAIAIKNICFLIAIIVTGPAKFNHLSAKKSATFFVFALS